MTISVDEFLADMEDGDFAKLQGPWQAFSCFDPPFSRADLRAMRRAGVIELDEAGKRFRLLVEAPTAGSSASDGRIEMSRA